MEQVKHNERVIRLLAESLLVFIFLTVSIAVAAYHQTQIIWLFIFLQGLWIQRFYMVGHEGSHRKLWPLSPKFNDFCGQLFLFPMLVPVTVFRQIHFFHHGHNRRNNNTSALEVYIVNGKYRFGKKIWPHLMWYLAVFAGGFFLHSLASILILLIIPPRVARKVSPAFRGWSGKKQLKAFMIFAAGIALHTIIIMTAGGKMWLYVWGFPFLCFAWVYSLLMYIYHFRTSIGSQVNHNVRSVRPGLIYSWWLMNFNEHETHHANPSIPWYSLPVSASSEKNKRLTLTQAILQQLRGPTIVEK